MKKSLFVVAALCAPLAVYSCGNSEQNSNTEQESSTEQNNDKQNEEAADGVTDKPEADAKSEDSASEDIIPEVDTDVDPGDHTDEGQETVTDGEGDDATTEIIIPEDHTDEDPEIDGNSEADPHNDGICTEDEVVPSYCSGRSVVREFLDLACNDVYKDYSVSCLTYKYAPVAGSDETINLYGTCAEIDGVPTCTKESKACTEDAKVRTACIANHTVTYHYSCGDFDDIVVTEGCNTDN